MNKKQLRAAAEGVRSFGASCPEVGEGELSSSGLLSAIIEEKDRVQAKHERLAKSLEACRKTEMYELGRLRSLEWVLKLMEADNNSASNISA